MQATSRLLFVLAVATALAALSAAGAAAATIKVTSTMDGSFDDVGCNLRDAVNAANTNSVVGDCRGDTAGADTILLEGGKTYRIERHAVDDTNAEGDFDIDGPVTIRATGGGLATVDANNIAGAGGAPDADRVFDVLFEAGSVVFERLKITGGFIEVPPIGVFVGGAGVFSRSNLTLRESEVVGNTVTGIAFLAGGGIFTETALGKLTIENSTVADNTLLSHNGGLSNEAVGGGVAAFNGAKSLTIVNSTISGNAIVRSSGEANPIGGGIYASAARTGAATSLRSVTVNRNSAEKSGGAELAAATLAGTIIAGNTTTAPTSTECHASFTGVTSLGGNLIGAAEAGSAGSGSGCNFGNPADRYGTKAAPVPPNLSPLAGNGGLTRTSVPNAGSPAIDLGGPCPATDQRGLFRFAAAPCDAGAVEVGASAAPPSEPGPGPGPGLGPGQSPPPASPPAARLAVAGKAKLSGPPGGRLTLSSGLRASCPAGGPACTGRLGAVPPLPPKRGSGKPRTYGTARISLAPGASRILTVKLTRAASGRAREAGALRVKITASLQAPGVGPAAATRIVNVKPPPARR